MPAPDDRTAVLLLHGFWHGSWCWTEVLARLTAAGVRALAVDMAGHGLRASRPAALTRRPFAAEALAAEVSPVADVDLDQAGDLLVAQVKQLGGGAPVTVVAHSMGGAVLTRAGQLAPELIAHAVYLTALMPASGVPRRPTCGCRRTRAAGWERCRWGTRARTGRCAWTSRPRTRRTGRPCARPSTATSTR